MHVRVGSGGASPRKYPAGSYNIEPLALQKCLIQPLALEVRTHCTFGAQAPVARSIFILMSRQGLLAYLKVWNETPKM